MMMKIRNITALLALIVLLGTACGTGEQAEMETTDKETLTAASEVSSDGAESLICPVAESDFGGQAYRILYPEWFLYNDYFFADEETGDQMNDAIYERTRITEEHLNVTLEPITFGYIETIQPKVKEAVLGGDDAYDLVLTHCITGVGSMVTENWLTDWNTLAEAGITFDERWWNENMNNRLSIHGKRPYAVSAYMLGDPNAILFNKGMIDTFQLEDPYSLVYDGTWTWDKLTEMSKQVSKDVDGNGIYDKNDMYGFGAHAGWMLNSIPYSCDQYIVEKRDGTYEVALYTEKMISIVEKMDMLFNGSNSSFMWTEGTNGVSDKTMSMATDRLLFDFVALNDSVYYRQCDVEFGILPFPKYDKAQQEYISFNWCGLMCVPTTAASIEMIARTSEMLAFTSLTTTQPAYKEVLLTGKLARDDESAEMVDIIFDGMVCDFGMNYLNFNDLTFTISRLVARDKSTDFTSWYNKNINQLEQQLAALNEAYQ